MTTYKRWAPDYGVVFSYKRGGQLHKTKAEKPIYTNYVQTYRWQWWFVRQTRPAILLLTLCCSIASLSIATYIAVSTSVMRQTQRLTIWQSVRSQHYRYKRFGSGGIRTHASEETGALHQRLRPLGHAILVLHWEIFELLYGLGMQFIY